MVSYQGSNIYCSCYFTVCYDCNIYGNQGSFKKELTNKMRNNLLTYLARLCILTIILGIIGLILFKTILSAYYLPVFWLVILLFLITHAISQLIIFTTVRKGRIKFENAYLLAFLVKFVSYLIFLIIYLTISDRITITFAVIFFLLYLIYTLFDVRTKILLSKTKTEKIE